MNINLCFSVDHLEGQNLFYFLLLVSLNVLFFFSFVHFSGKTMTLFSALRSLPACEVVGLNFSCATTPELILKTFAHYCEYKKTATSGVVLAPNQLGKWIIVFCDEINLPDEDKYGTQRVIAFLRQCIEHGGFYRTSDHTWIHLERIQFVGACNPPTDPGRKPLSHR